TALEVVQANEVLPVGERVGLWLCGRIRTRRIARRGADRRRLDGRRLRRVRVRRGRAWFDGRRRRLRRVVAPAERVPAAEDEQGQGDQPDDQQGAARAARI